MRRAMRSESKVLVAGAAMQNPPGFQPNQLNAMPPLIATVWPVI